MKYLMSCWQWLALASVLLSSCGGSGGGGGGSSSGGGVAPDGPRQPQATGVRNDDPTGLRPSVGPNDYLPVDGGGQWVYQRLDDAGRPLGSTRVTATVSGVQITVTEADDLQAAVSTTYRRESRGRWCCPSRCCPGVSANANRIIGNVLPYASPFHAIGSVRVQLRAGDCGQDLDRDGINESFELELRQTIVGYGTVAGPTGPIETLHIRDELRLTVIPSRRDSATATATATLRSDNWPGHGIGTVRKQRSSTVPAGQVAPAPYTLAPVSVRIAGNDPLDLGALTQVMAIDLPNGDLVFDAARARCYASVPRAVLGQGNRIASIADAGRHGGGGAGLHRSQPQTGRCGAGAGQGAAGYVAVADRASTVSKRNPAWACSRRTRARPMADPAVQTPPGVAPRSTSCNRHSAASQIILLVDP